MDPDPYSDPDLDWIRMQEGKNGPENLKTVNKFHLLKCCMFSFEG